MKIIHFAKTFSANGGVGNYLLRLCPALKAAGYETGVIHADSNARAGGGIESFQVPAFDDPGNSVVNAQILDVLEKARPDIVHIHANENLEVEKRILSRWPTVKSIHVYDFCPSGTKFHHASHQVCRRPTGAPCLAHMVFNRCTQSKRPKVIWNFYKNAMANNEINRLYPKLIVATGYVKRQALETGYRDEQVEVIPYFTEYPALSGDESENLILFSGRVVAEKGLELLLRAAALLPRDLNWRLAVDGDGPELTNLKKLAASLKLEEKVQFCGWLNKEKHWEIFRKAAVVAVPSIWPEPFGLVGIEAMSYAKPVVAFAVGGIPEWLKDGETGYLIPPYDHRQMAEKIAFLLRNREAARQMGINGRNFAEETFTQDKHVNRLTEIYKTVLNIHTPCHPERSGGSDLEQKQILRQRAPQDDRKTHA